MKTFIATAALLVAGAAQASVTTYFTNFEPEGGGTRSGTGTASAAFDDVSNVFTFLAVFSGLSGLTTQAHFHCCTTAPFMGTAGIAIDSPTLPIPLGVSAGSFGATFDLDDAASFHPPFITASGGLAGAIARFRAGLDNGQTYLNIHTTTFGGGEIRGFMRVPEPASAALALVALAALAALGAVGGRQRRS